MSLPNQRRNFIGVWTLFKRESLRFLSLPNQTILPALVTITLYIVIFGFVLGSKVATIDGEPYIVFIFPGLLLMGIVMSSFENASTTLFVARWEHFIEDLLVAPVTFVEMVIAPILAALLRALLTAVAMVIIGFLITPTPLHHPVLLLINLTATSVVFSSLGLICGLWADRWDHIAICENYMVTPLVFLGGIFYSTSSLPEGYRWINELNPLFYMVSGTRYAFLGKADVSFGTSLAVTTAIAAIFLAIAIELFRRGYKLRT